MHTQFSELQPVDGGGVDQPPWRQHGRDRTRPVLELVDYGVDEGVQVNARPELTVGNGVPQVIEDHWELRGIVGVIYVAKGVHHSGHGQARLADLPLLDDRSPIHAHQPPYAV